MQTWQAAILGLVEGITEYLPVSSTGHLIVTSSLLGLDGDEVTKASVDTFNIVIQGGAILAVLGLYARRVRSMTAGLVGRDPDGLRLLIRLFIAFLPAAILGPLLDDRIEAALFHPMPVLAALALGGVALLLLGPWQKRRLDADAGGDAPERTIDTLTINHALIIGLLQCVAMWPGTSRSMMTIIGGMLVGLRPKQAAEFSFLLGLPTLGGACVYKLLKEFSRPEGERMWDVLGWEPMVAGLLVATVSAALAVKWLVGFLGRHGLAAFGWYRIAFAGVLAALWYAGIVFTDDVAAGIEDGAGADDAGSDDAEVEVDAAAAAPAAD